MSLNCVPSSRNGVKPFFCPLFRANDYKLSAPDAFTIFSIFTSLQFTVAVLPYALKCLAEGKVALDRLQKFLELPEYTPPGASDRDLSTDGYEDGLLTIKIQNANLAWPVAPNMNLKKGKQAKSIER